ncbi:MAG: PepSY domain-containing protein [Thioalkalivibrionaceae bacterium]
MTTQNLARATTSLNRRQRFRALPVMVAMAMAVGAVGVASAPVLAQTMTDVPSSEQRNAPMTVLQAIEQARSEGVEGVLIEVETKDRRGAVVHELEFFDGRYETELRIDAQSGRVLKKAVDAQDDSPSRADRAARKLSLYETATVTIEDAIRAALDEGLKIEGVELEEDDGRLTIEMDLRRADRAEIKRKIDAVTGEVLSEKIDD